VKVFNELDGVIELWQQDGHEDGMKSRFFRYEDAHGVQGFVLYAACDDEELPESLEDVVKELQAENVSTPSMN
jgi:hypothetical protein